MRDMCEGQCKGTWFRKGKGQSVKQGRIQGSEEDESVPPVLAPLIRVALFPLFCLNFPLFLYS